MKESCSLIQFDRVSKRYRKRSRTLQEALGRFFGRFSAGRVPDSLMASEFWALRDVSFEVERGETLGIIGENGAGKSTILKLIAGIIGPSTGHITVTGRVGCLIDLGAGFNPELTGAENIFLNGTLLGLSRKEISKKLDQIVTFSGLQDFMSVPVKYYSSGMYAKLGFSVAAHVDADILLTDEILAVGDAAFQRQCFEKFQELKASSTIVLVSHDLFKVKQICTRAMWVHRGRIECGGEPGTVIDAYQHWVQQNRERQLQAGTSVEFEPGAMRWGSGEIEILAVTTHDGKGQPRSVFRTFDDLLIRIHCRVKEGIQQPGFGVIIRAGDGGIVYGTNTSIQGTPVTISQEGGVVEILFPRLPLLPGTYWVSATIAPENNFSAPYDVREQIQRFEVMSDLANLGVVTLDHHWRMSGET